MELAAGPKITDIATKKAEGKGRSRQNQERMGLKKKEITQVTVKGFLILMRLKSFLTMMNYQWDFISPLHLLRIKRLKSLER